MISLENFKKAFAQMPSYIKEAEVNCETHNIIIVSESNGKVEDIQMNNFSEFYLRVASEKNGYAYTQCLDENPMELIEKAYQNSLSAEKSQLESMNRENRQIVYSDKEAIKDINLLSNKAIEIESKILEKLNKENVEITVELKSETYGQNTVNSYGFEAVNYVPVYILSVSANSQDRFATIEQTKNSVDEFDLDQLAENLKLRLSWQQNQSAGFVSGDYPVILSAEAVYSLISTAWQELASHKYLDGGSIYSGKLNEKIMADCLSFTDYTTIKNSGFEFNCDCEGSEGKDCQLVENGVLVGLMTNATSAKALDISNSANAGRRPLLFGNIATDILVTPKNFCIEPSDKSLDELIQNMNNGILITEYFDVFHSLNIASGSFSVPCFGVLIENGKMVKNLKALTMTGNLKDLLFNAIEVGNDFMVRPMYYLHNFGIGACSIRFAKVTISGE